MLRMIFPHRLALQVGLVGLPDTHKGVSFGALTSENRDTWTRVRISSVVVSFGNGVERATGAPTTDRGLTS